MSNCPQEQLELIYRYLDGDLTSEELQSMEAHMERCDECTSEYTWECLIREALKRTCCEKAPEELRAAIQVRLTQVTTFSSD